MAFWPLAGDSKLYRKAFIANSIIFSLKCILMFDTVYVHVESGNKIAGFWSSQNDLCSCIEVKNMTATQLYSRELITHPWNEMCWFQIHQQCPEGHLLATVCTRTLTGYNFRVASKINQTTTSLVLSRWDLVNAFQNLFIKWVTCIMVPGIVWVTSPIFRQHMPKQ